MKAGQKRVIDGIRGWVARGWMLVAIWRGATPAYVETRPTTMPFRRRSHRRRDRRHR